MPISRNTLLSAIFAFGTLAVVAHDAQACPPSRGGGYARSYSSHSYSQPSYNSYSTPSYQSYSQPTYQNYSQPVQVIRQLQPVQSTPSQQFVPQQQAPVQQISQSQQVAPQQQFGQQPQQQQVSPPQQFGQQPQQQQVAPPQQFAQQPQQQQQVAPQQQFGQQPQQQQVTPQQSQGNPAAMSALQALGGLAAPQTVAPQQQQQQVQTPIHVGNWTASLGNGSTVRLTLQADGAFSWVATNKAGGTSSFSGSYTVENGSLNLNRSNDNQQLGGNMTISGDNAFSFKVAGNNAASIDFQRS